MLCMQTRTSTGTASGTAVPVLPDCLPVVFRAPFCPTLKSGDEESPYVLVKDNTFGAGLDNGPRPAHIQYTRTIVASGNIIAIILILR